MRAAHSELGPARLVPGRVQSSDAGPADARAARPPAPTVPSGAGGRASGGTNHYQPYEEACAATVFDTQAPACVCFLGGGRGGLYKKQGRDGSPAPPSPVPPHLRVALQRGGGDAKDVGPDGRYICDAAAARAAERSAHGLSRGRGQGARGRPGEGLRMMGAMGGMRRGRWGVDGCSAVRCSACAGSCSRPCSKQTAGARCPLTQTRQPQPNPTLPRQAHAHLRVGVRVRRHGRRQRQRRHRQRGRRLDLCEQRAHVGSDGHQVRHGGVHGHPVDLGLALGA